MVVAVSSLSSSTTKLADGAALATPAMSDPPSAVTAITRALAAHRVQTARVVNEPIEDERDLVPGGDQRGGFGAAAVMPKQGVVVVSW